jgi:tetratricopeptide (TPR) repeat protein
MDPISRMVRDFTNRWKRFRQDERVILFRIDTAPRMHSDLLRLLRGLEMSPDNHSPYLIVCAAFADRAQFFQAATVQLETDYALLKEGLAKDGVTIAALSPARADARTPEEAYGRRVLAAWEHLSKAPLAGLVVILVPATLGERSGWSSSVERLVRLFSGSKVRLAAADTPEGLLTSLAEKLGRTCFSGAFLVADTTVQEYLMEIAAGGAAAAAGSAPGRGAAAAVQAPLGPPAPPPPGTPKVLPTEAAAQLRKLMASAAVATAQNNPAAAIAALREARQLCKAVDQQVEEAVVLLAIGNNYLASQQPEQAIRHYEESASVAGEAAAPVVAAQAHMAIGSSLFRGGEYDRAAPAYELAAADSEAGESDLLRIEALRMAGTCHALRERPSDAARCWKLALGTCALTTPAELQASTFDQVATAFIELCKQRGLTEQAKSVAQEVAAIKARAALPLAHA